MGPAPAEGESNPLRDKVVEAIWPRRSARPRRASTSNAAPRWSRGTLGAANDRCRPTGARPARLGRRRRRAAGRAVAQRRHRSRPSCPASSRSAPSSSWTVIRRALSRLNRRLPARPDPHALLGTAFHDWVQRFYGAERLFDLDDLPGAGRRRLPGRRRQLAELQAAFTASRWAARTPVDVEVPFEMAIGDTRRARPDRRGVRRRRRRRDRGRLEDRRTAGRSRRPAARRRPARGVPAGLGGAAGLPGVARCARRSTTCEAGATVSAGEPARPRRTGRTAGPV